MLSSLQVLAVSNKAGKVDKDNNNKASLLSGRRSESAHALNTATEPHSMPPQGGHYSTQNCINVGLSSLCLTKQAKWGSANSEKGGNRVAN